MTSWHVTQYKNILFGTHHDIRHPQIYSLGTFMQNNEIKKIKTIYYILIAVSIAVVVFTFFLEQGRTNSEKQFYAERSVIIPFQKETSDDGLTKTYYFSADEIKSNGSCLLFHERHHDVSIFSGDTKIYELKAERTLVGKTTGYKWIFCSVPDDSSIVKVVFTALYNDVKADDPAFFVGHENYLYDSLFLDAMPEFLIGIFNIACGIVVLICYFIMKRKSKSVGDLIYITIDAIIFGMYELVNSNILQLLVSNQVALSSISFFLLMLLSVPFVLYIKETLFAKDKCIYKALIIYSFLESLLCIILVFTNVRDLKETAFLSHIAIILSGIYAISGIINEIKQNGLHGTIIANMLGLTTCVVASIFDILRYYDSSKGTEFDEVFIRFGFTLYIVILICINFINILKEIQLGKQAEYYKELALMDIMTKLYNHNAFMQDADALLPSDTYAIVSMDLNNLKKVNDQQGHIEGDKYITNAADAIVNTFDKYGKCYRPGGDEFTVLLLNKNADKAEDLIQKLNEYISKYNESLPEDAPNRLIIASGFAKNNPASDTGFESVLKRADEMMYENKVKIKHSSAVSDDGYVDTRLL